MEGGVRTAEGDTVELANEIRLPVGERTEITLASADVIHSFWVPSLGGKIDMIPGRVNRMALEPTRTGVFRGACAEYCGRSHARMNFVAVVMEREAFDAWLEAGMLDMDQASLEAWIARTEEIKPGVHMPSFGMLPLDDVRAMAAWLAGLE